MTNTQEATTRKTAHEMLGNRDPKVCSCSACGWARGNGERYVSPATFTPEQLCRLTFEVAEDKYRRGALRQEDWEAYAHVWRTSVPRLSDVASAHESSPTDPLVLEIVAEMRAVLAANEDA